MTPIFREDTLSQIPALQLLIKMGYKYIPQTECEALRIRTSNVILEDFLREQLKRINKIDYKNETHDFSESNIETAITLLKKVPFHEGYMTAIQKIYEQLVMGISLEQSIGDDKKSFTLKYIDWENVENNIFHVTSEFNVKREASNEHYIPDIVCFVNGVPFVVIECKGSNIKNPIEEAIKQHLRNQETDGIRQLYVYSQIICSISMNDVSYGTTNTELEFWSKWREVFYIKGEKEKHFNLLNQIKNQAIDKNENKKIFSELFFEKYVSYYKNQSNESFTITKQDELIFSILHPRRLLELSFHFIVFEEGIKKIAMYQQYFSVNRILERIKYIEGGKRKGGVIWHTQGSGKSLTMVMLAEKIASETSIMNPKIILVTDRIDLDIQLSETFKKCGKVIEQANTGSNLVELLESNSTTIISTVINKFEAGVNRLKKPLTSSDIFVLVDEAHRSQYGSFNIQMQKSLPNACFISFTGTPLMKKEKNTAAKFGGIIDVYPISIAVQDKAVLPLLFEGRNVIQNVNAKPLDHYFDLISQNLTDKQKTDLKRKFNRADQLNIADQKIYCIAWDISKHYQDNWQGTGLKGQLVTQSKNTALKYKKYLDDIGIVSSEVVISPPDMREGIEGDEEERQENVILFWKNIIDQYGTQEKYEKQIISRFKKQDHPEIIIVVDKLLTGFDAPRNTVLYITRSLKEHSLLQAIARVNRKYPGKDFGYIIDYYGILGELDEAMATYSSLKDFEEEELVGTLSKVTDEIKLLPQRYTDLHDIFKTIENKYDSNAYEELLRDEELREKFYEKLSIFCRTLKLALSTLSFHKETTNKIINKYKNDAIFFLKLRVSVKKRYSDEIDFKQYESQIQKLIDKHIESSEVIKITELINIFDEDSFQKEVEKLIGEAAKADMIASRTEKVIFEKLEEDPAFYRKFSELLKETIKLYVEKRISEVEYLKKIKEICNKVLKHEGDYPDELKNNETTQAFYGILLEHINSKIENNKTISSKLSFSIEDIFKKNIYDNGILIIDWQRKKDLLGRLSISIEDCLIDELNEKYSIGISFDIIDEIREKIIEVAKRRFK